MGYYIKHEQTTRDNVYGMLHPVGFLKFDPALLQRHLVSEGFNSLEDFSAQTKQILQKHKKQIEDELGDSIL